MTFPSRGRFMAKARALRARPARRIRQRFYLNSCSQADAARVRILRAHGFSFIFLALFAANCGFPVPGNMVTLVAPALAALTPGLTSNAAASSSA